MKPDEALSLGTRVPFVHWLAEGGPIQRGLNLYPMGDKSSVGGILRIGRRVWRVRWSKVRSRLFCSAGVIS